MAHAQPYALVSKAQKVLWRAELLGLIQSDPILSRYDSMMDRALFFSEGIRSPCLHDFGETQLIVYRDPVQPKYVLVIFNLLKRHQEIGTSSINHTMVGITLYAQVARLNDATYINFVVSPDDHEPVEFIGHAASHGSKVLQTTTIGLNDLLDRFPRHVENILTQMSFVTGVMQDTESMTSGMGGNR